MDRYFEDKKAGFAGVIADSSISVVYVIVAADAFNSRSELLISGEHLPTRLSGMSVYRGAFLRSLTLDDPVFEKSWSKDAYLKEYWLSPGIYIGLYVSPNLVAFGLTPRNKFLLENSDEPTES